MAVLEGTKSPTGKPMLMVSHEMSNTVEYLDLADLVRSKGVNAGAFTSSMLKDVAGGDTLKITPLLTIGEVVNSNTPGASVYVGTGVADGMGAYDNGNGTYSLLVNSEISNSAGYQYQVSVKSGSAAAITQTVTGARISKYIVAKDLDGNAKNGYQSGMLSGGLAYSEVISPDSSFGLGSGLTRLCSASMTPAGQFKGRGFIDKLFLTGEETKDGRFFALDPVAEKLYHVPALGKGGWETGLAVDTGNANTVAVILCDDTHGIANYLYMWAGSKVSGSTDLLARNGIAAECGSLYAWKATKIANTPEGIAGVPLNSFISGAWVKLGSGAEIAALPTAEALRTLASNAGAMQFTRIEDAAVNALGKLVAFTTTGGSGVDLYGNTQVLNLVSTFGTDGLVAPGKITSLQVKIDADRLTGVAPQSDVRNPDGIEYSGTNLYIQEDRSVPAGVDVGQFGSEEASIWKYDTVTGLKQRWAQVDRTAVPTVYGQSDSAATDVGNWETSGHFDVSSMYGAAAGNYFITDIQAHSINTGSIVGGHYLGEGGQIVLTQVNPVI